MQGSAAVTSLVKAIILKTLLYTILEYLVRLRTLEANCQDNELTSAVNYWHFCRPQTAGCWCEREAPSVCLSVSK